MYAELPEEVLESIVDDVNGYSLQDEIDQRGEELEEARYKFDPRTEKLDFFIAWSNSLVFYLSWTEEGQGIIVVPRHPPLQGQTMEGEY